MHRVLSYPEIPMKEYLGEWNHFSFNCTAEHGKKRTEHLWTNFGPALRQLSIYDMGAS